MALVNAFLSPSDECCRYHHVSKPLDTLFKKSPAILDCGIVGGGIADSGKGLGHSSLTDSRTYVTDILKKSDEW